MDEFREGDERPRPSVPTPANGPGAAAPARLEEVGDLHYRAAAYSSAIEYYRSALRTAERDAGSSREGAVRRGLLARKLADCFLQQGHSDEAGRELDAAAELLSDAAAAVQATVKVRRALLLYRSGCYDGAAELAREAFTVLAATDSHLEVGNAQAILGGCYFRLGRAEKAEEFFQDALATYRRIEHVPGQAQVLSNLGLLAKNACRWSRALQLFDRAEELMRASGAARELCSLQLNKAVLYRKMGRGTEALACVLRGSEMGRSLGEAGLLTKFRLLHGQLQIEDGRYADAERNLLEARVLAERTSAARETALADEFLGDLMAAQGRAEEAELNYGIAEARAREISASNDILAEVLRRRAQLALRVGRASAAVQLAASGIEVGRTCGEQYELGFLERVRGEALLAAQRPDEARLALQEALSRFRSYKLPAEVARTLQLLAALHQRLGGREHLLAARGMLREAIEIMQPEGECAPCRAQLALARVELELGNLDEALLALFEVERMTCQGAEGVGAEVEALRERIETAMSSTARAASSRYQELAELPEPVAPGAEGFAPTAATLLAAVIERVGGERGFVALHGPRERVHLLAAVQIPRLRARRVAAHVLNLLSQSAIGSGPRVWTRPLAEAAWREVWGEDVGAMSTAVAFPVVRDDALCGVVYVDVAREQQALGAERLAVASTYVDVLRATLVDAAGALTHAGEVATLPAEEAFRGILTRSQTMLDVLALCAKVADAPYTVLFTGETGTGKGMLAYSIHCLSSRRSHTFLTLNCAAIPDTLLESELFGYVRGAFTGADRDREGLILGAEHGTLFLDEVGKMSLPMQAKLLHFLDTKQVRPVGGTASRVADVRILCASKQDLKAMVERNEFLEDLYYRLLDFPVHVPPLRERPEDVQLLAQHFVEKTCAELGRPAPAVTRAFLVCLRAYAWPGNVRELEKTIRQAVILASGEPRLRAAHLPVPVRSAANVVDDGCTEGDTTGAPLLPLREQLAEVERQVLSAALARLHWNRAAVARQLRISYPTLLQKIKAHHLRPTA